MLTEGAAQGGRFGSAGDEGFAASQEFGNYVNRQNSQFGAASQSDAQAEGERDSLVLPRFQPDQR